MMDPSANTCFDFAHQFENMEQCQEAAAILVDKFIPHPDVSDIATKCEEINE
jgi:hypothetical protein